MTQAKYKHVFGNQMTITPETQAKVNKCSYTAKETISKMKKYALDGRKITHLTRS